MTEQKIPKISCICKREMEPTHTNAVKGKLREARYKCKCTITAMALINQDSTYDLYFYNENKKLIKYATNVTD